MHVHQKECRADQKMPKENGWKKVYDCVIAYSSLKGRISDMQVIEDFESRPHKAVTFLCGKERQEWNEQKQPKAPGHSGGRLPGRSTEERGREKEEECVKRKQWQEKNKKIEEGIKSSQRTALEEEESWQEGDQMAEQLEDEQHLEEVVERRRMAGRSLKLNVIQKVPELVVNKRMSQGERVKKPKEKKVQDGLLKR